VAADGLFDEGPIVRVDRAHAGLLVEWEIGAFVAELLPGVHVGDATVTGVAVGHVNVPDADVRAADRQLDAGVDLSQLLFQLFAGRDVGAGAEPLDGVAPVVTDRHPPRLEPAVRAVEPSEAVLDLVFALPLLDGGPPGLLGAFPVLGVQRLQPAPAQQFAQRPAHVLHGLDAAVVQAAVGRGRPNQLWQRLDQAPPTLLALPQPLLELQPFQFGRRAGGEDSKYEQLARFGGHRLLVEDRQVAEVRSLCVAERHAQGALDAPVHAQPVLREPLAPARRGEATGGPRP